MRCCSVLMYILCICASGLNSVAEVLEKHGLQKPISYVRNSQNSEEEAHQLMVKLCRHTGRRYRRKHAISFQNMWNLSKEKSNRLLRNPAVNETVWRGLLQDLLDMQQNVYTCLKDETCHQVRKTRGKAK